jgi:hypothetical protein
MNEIFIVVKVSKSLVAVKFFGQACFFMAGLNIFNH